MKVKYKSHLIVSSLMIMVWVLVACQIKQTSVKGEFQIPEAIKPVDLSEEEKALKQKLTILKERYFFIDETINVDEYMADMIKHLGSAESELRDDLIDEAFDTWLFSNWLDIEQINKLLEALLADDKLMYGIGEKGTDSVFTRSFSIRKIGSIVLLDQFERILTDEQRQNVATRLTEYLNQEKDCRGYVEVKGRANGIGYASDTIAILARDESLDEQQLLALLNGLGLAMSTKEHEYADGEEWKAYEAITSILDRELIKDTDLTIWAENLTQSVLEENEEGYRISHANRWMFLRMVKMYIEINNKAEIIEPIIEKFLNEGNGA